MRKFTADIKGGILKSGRFQLVQGKPFTDARNNEKLYDIIGRIKKGMYPGADYVLFGTINSIEFRQEANPIDHTNTVSHTLSLELVGEFSLISTKNFTTSQGGRVVLNRGKVVSEVSRSLGEDVARQLEEQISGVYGGSDDGGEQNLRPREESPRGEVIIFK